MASIAFPTSSGRQSISLPAINASTEITPPGKYFATPFISSASVNVRPLKPRSSLKMPVTVFLEIEVARCSPVSIDGTERCATITLPMPAFINSRKGFISFESSSALDLFITGRSRCESTSTSPCPGKCLAQAIIPASCMPFI